MELNIFKEAKLSPSETDKKKIIDGLNKRIKNLVGQRNQKIISKEECDEMQSYLKALIDEIESNPGIIAKHAKQYLDSFRKEIMDFASILIDGETKEITQEALDAVVKKFKSKGFTDKDLLDILGVKVRTKGTVVEDDGDEDQDGPTLDATLMKNINTSLEKLKYRNVYHFLGLKESVDQKTFADTIMARFDVSARKTTHTDMETVAHHLLQKILELAKDPDARKRYDTSLSQQGFNDVKEQIAALAVAKFGFVDGKRYKALLESCLKNGLGEPRARKLINKELKRVGISFDDGSGSASTTVVCRFCGTICDNKSKMCSGCGMPIEVECPSCGKRSSHDDLRCTHCGFAIGDMPQAMTYLSFAETAIRQHDMETAESNLKIAAGFWPNNAQIRKLNDQVVAERDKQKGNVDQMRNLCSAHKYYAAMAMASTIGNGSVETQLKNEAKAAIAQVEKLLETAKNSSDGAARLDTYLKILTVCADCKEAQAQLDLLQLPAPSALAADLKGDIVSLKWQKCSSPYISYVVIRKENGMPSSPTDGQQLAETNDGAYADSKTESGKSYFYAVFSKCGDKLSKTGAVMNEPVVKVADLSPSQISVTTDETSLEFSIKSTVSTAAIEIYRDGKVVKTLTGSSFVDSGLKSGQTYQYRFVVVVKDSIGREHRSGGLTLQFTPMPKAKPVDITISDDDKSAVLSWSSTSVGVVSIYYSDTPFKYNKNDNIIMDTFKASKLNVSGTTCTVNKDFSGVRYYLPVTIVGNMGVAGGGVSLLSISKVGGVEVVRDEREVEVKWKWEGNDTVRVSYNVGDGKDYNKDFTRATCASATYKFSLPQTAKSVEVKVMSVVKCNGQVMYGAAVVNTISLQASKVMFESITNVKRLFMFSSNTYEISLSTDSVLPCDLHVLVSEGCPPIDLVHYRPAHVVSKSMLKVGTTYSDTFEYVPRQKGKKLYFRVIAADRNKAKQVTIVPELRNI